MNSIVPLNFAPKNKVSFLGIMLVLLLTSFDVNGQGTRNAPGTISPDSVKIFLGKDSLSPEIDTNKVVIKDSLNYKVSKEGLDAPVTYNAQDSIIFQVNPQQVHLYGKASVVHKDLSLKAGYILIDFKTKIITAQGLADSLNKAVERPEFVQGSEEFRADTIRYNFETRKGIVSNVTTQYEDMYVLSNRTKLDLSGTVTGEGDDIVYSQNSLFTTCNHPEPHYGIRSNQQKVIPEKLIVVGPSNLEIAKVPTPVWLPFGFFPIKKDQKSGILIPEDYETSPVFGFGLKDFGYYWAINNRVDLTVRASIFTRGSWGLSVSPNYRKKYKYNGSFTFSYDRRVTDEIGTPNYSLIPSYNIRWSHRQDPKAHPSQSFSASVNIQGNNNLALTNNDAANVLRGSLSSNITYNKNFLNSPFSLTAGFGHSQNTQTKEVEMTLPNLTIQMKQIYPFKSKKGGNAKWFEKIGLTYGSVAQNLLTTTDSTLFTRQTLESAQYGARHKAGLSGGFNVLKYFNFTPSIDYSEKWYFESTAKVYDPTPTIVIDTAYVNGDSSDVLITVDTTSLGEIVESSISGFKPLREFSARASLSTKLFGMMNFKRGKLAAIRHTMTPSVSYSFTPDYTNPSWGYFDTVYVDNDLEDYEAYSIFENGIYGSASSSGLSSSINFSLGNVLEGKTRQQKDSIETFNKIKIWERLNLSSSYNMAADSLHFSQVNLTGNSTFFKMINVNIAARFDPYSVNEDGNRIQEFYIDEANLPLRFVNLTGGFGTRVNIRTVRELLNGYRTNDEIEEEEKPGESSQFLKFLETLNLNYNYRFAFSEIEGVDSFRTTVHSVDLRGININLTKNWRMTIGNIGYDFKGKEITYPDFSFYRDLHCWEMGTSWQPQRGTFSFFLRVKPSTLGFINIPYQKNNYDPPDVF